MWEGTLIIRCCAMVMLYTSTLTVDPVLAGTGIEVLQQWQAEQENENQESDRFDTHGDHFGCALALDGNFAIVGAQFNHAYRYGGAYSFWNMSNQTWTRDSMLTVNQCVNNLTDCGDDGYRRESYQELGNAVDIFKVSETEAWALVGATGFDNDGNGTGVVEWYSGQVFLMQLHSGDWTLKEIYKPWDGPAPNNKY